MGHRLNDELACGRNRTQANRPLSAISHQLSAISYQLSAISHQLSAVNRRGFGSLYCWNGPS